MAIKKAVGKKPFKIAEGRPMFEIREISVSGVRILVQIDYRTKKVSFMEQPNGSDYKVKKWNFSERGREYLGGWLQIFEAMKQATLMADELLRQRETEETVEKAELMHEIGKREKSK